MPDPAKFQALRDYGFIIAETCGTCQHWVKTGNGWGVCQKITYQHGKHSGIKQMGTPSNGLCNKYDTDGAKMLHQVQSYSEFIA